MRRSQAQITRDWLQVNPRGSTQSLTSYFSEKANRKRKTQSQIESRWLDRRPNSLARGGHGIVSRRERTRRINFRNSRS
jgi:hypothetical protein